MPEKSFDDVLGDYSTPESATLLDKATLYLVLSAVTLVLYFGAQRVSLVSSTRLSLTWFDTKVSFDPHWAWIYQTIYVVTPAIAFCLKSLSTLRRYMKAFLALLIPSTIFFLLLPIEGPVVEMYGLDPMYDFVLSYAGKVNCLPSLHVGMATLSFPFLRDACQERAIPFRIAIVSQALLGTWLFLLCYSTIAVKQHYFIDIPCGIAVAIAAHRLTLMEKA